MGASYSKTIFSIEPEALVAIFSRKITPAVPLDIPLLPSTAVPPSIHEGAHFTNGSQVGNSSSTDKELNETASITVISVIALSSCLLFTGIGLAIYNCINRMRSYEL